jgi:uncharacterized protein (DUF2267 family)
VPSEYQRATDDFYKFLEDARDAAGFTTTNQAYTMAQGVLRVFRRRLEVSDAIRVLSVLPVGLRALFVMDWDISEPKRLFEDHSHMTKEAQSLRPLHNFSPESAIRDVASALRRNIDQAALDRVLKTISEGAVQFWQV